jgi:ribonuclease HII
MLFLMRKRKIKLTKRLRIPRQDHEEFLHEQGFKVVCGLDEVGRGSWAGPLVAAAVILPTAPNFKSQNSNVKRLYGIRDSKLLTAKEREKLAKKIKRTSKVSIGEVSVKELNQLKLTKATQLAFRRAVLSLSAKPDFVLADGFKFDSPLPCRALKKGDMICSSIAAASIVAKVYRDKLMRKLDKEIKGYNFSKHKGYGTRLHQDRLKKLGPSKAHRMFYKSLK